MKLFKNTLGFLLAPLLVLCSYSFLDKEIALLVKRTVLSSEGISLTIPDLLFPFVCIVTGGAWTAYFYFVRKRIFNNHRRFALLVACSVPLASILKSVLKILVGRINTRVWLGDPELKEFHWFQGSGDYSGFPSGHMAVFAVLVIACWQFYPRLRSGYSLFLALLAIALIATGYHFLSDVIAGAYLGFIVHGFITRGLRLVRTTEDDAMTLHEDRQFHFNSP